MPTITPEVLMQMIGSLYIQNALLQQELAALRKEIAAAQPAPEEPAA